jgi:hypothetical protein
LGSQRNTVPPVHYSTVGNVCSATFEWRLSANRNSRRGHMRDMRGKRWIDRPRATLVANLRDMGDHPGT